MTCLGAWKLTLLQIRKAQSFIALQTGSETISFLQRNVG